MADDGHNSDDGNDKRTKLVTSKCYHCFKPPVAGAKLSICSRCKLARYCSRECQQKHWKDHKAMCNNNTEHAEALKNPLNPRFHMPVPDGITLSQLDQRLASFIKFHSTSLMAATIFSLDLRTDMKKAKTHVLRITLIPRLDHGGSPAKYFRIKTANALALTDTKELERDGPWAESIVELDNLRRESEKHGSGTVAACTVECMPWLTVQTVPFGSLTSTALSNLPQTDQWKIVLIKDVELGKRGNFR